MHFTGLLNQLKRLSILIASFIVGCQSNHSGEIAGGQIKLDSMGDLKRYQREFDVIEFRKLNTDGDRNSFLFFYENSCGLKLKKDSIKKVVSYVIFFSDSSNSSVDVVEFTSRNYTRLIEDQLIPYVRRVRQITGAPNGASFCLPYYLSRIYNIAEKGKKLYLFGYDGANVSSRTVTMKDLKYLDKVCGSLTAQH
jgi:hypothetical protein